MRIFTNKNIVKTFFLLLFVVIIAQSSLLGINSLRAAQPVLGMRFEHSVVSFYRESDLKSLITSRANFLEHAPVTIKVNKFRDHLTPRQLGVHYDSDTVSRKLNSFGKEGSLIDLIVAQDKALLGLENKDLGYPDINLKTARTYLERISPQANSVGKSAFFYLDKGSVEIQADVPSTTLNTVAAVDAIKNLDIRSDVSSQLFLPLKTTSSPITTADLSPIKSEVEKMVAQPIFLKANGQGVTVTPDQLLTFIVVKKEVSTPSLVSTQPTTTATTPTPAVVEKLAKIGFNDVAIGNTLDQLAQKVDQVPQPRITKGTKVIQEGKAGIHVDGPHAKV
jgi:hypothetical protein